jgi:GTP-binding protein EngB required for normal cell division
MLTANSLSDRAEVVRKTTLEIVTSLTDKARAFGLADPDSSLARYARKLGDNTYQVLVVGEAKRGKSTFVNALIGRDILPTDVDIATSQVFRVCPAAGEAYRLRLEDDSQQEIAAADLARYGSQVVADADGVPRLDQIIRWIEVDVPARFLPANVRLLDTPGLGALYAAHAQITHRFVPHADAVIFVLDSQAPIGEPEIDFVSKLLEVTRSIFFIQTKIDQFRRQAWEEVQKRSEDILRKRFGDRLPDPRVWPISSINLRKAAQTGDDDYLMVSRHRELAAALQVFLFRVAGWSRSAEAIVLAGHYQALARQTLAARLAALTEESKQKRAEFQQRAMERRKQFEADWGERGQKRRELLENIQKIAALGKQSLRNALQPGGDLERQFRSRIQALGSAAEREQLLHSLPQLVEDRALCLLQDVRRGTETKCAAVLAPFSLAADGVVSAPATDPLSSPLGRSSAPESPQGAAEKLLRMARGVSFAGGTASLLAAAGFGPAGIVVAPVILIMTLYVDQRAELRAGKQELVHYLADLLQRLRNHLLFEVDLARGQFNRVDECFNALERSLGEAIARLASQKLAEAQTEADRLGEEARLDEQARQEKGEETRRQVADWDAIGRRLHEARGELEALERGQGPAAGASA